MVCVSYLFADIGFTYLFAFEVRIKDHILNVSRIKSAMLNPPIGQRLHHFFAEEKDMLTNEEKREVIAIIEKSCEEICSLIRIGMK